jgi:LysM repeat protein
MHPQHHRSHARLIAPAALLAFVLAVALIVLGSSGSDDKGERKAAAPAGKTASATTTSARPAKRPGKSATYTVRPGDSLGRIAEKTGIEVQTLETINPSLDPQALIAGQKVKLRR